MSDQFSAVIIAILGVGTIFAMLTVAVWTVLTSRKNEIPVEEFRRRMLETSIQQVELSSRQIAVLEDIAKAIRELAAKRNTH